MKLSRIPLTPPPPSLMGCQSITGYLSGTVFACVTVAIREKLSPNFFRKGWLQHRIERNFSHSVVDSMDSRKTRKNLLDCVIAASFQKAKQENYRGWRLYYKQKNKTTRTGMTRETTTTIRTNTDRKTVDALPRDLSSVSGCYYC